MTYSSKNHSDAGYTLLELLVVLSLLALLGGIGLRLSVGAPAGLSVSAMAEEIASQAERARLLALQQAREVVLHVDVERRRTWIEGMGNEAELPKDASMILTAAAPEVHSVDLGGIRFFADGTSTGGKLRLSWHDRTKVVTVDWLLGRARVSDE